MEFAAISPDLDTDGKFPASKLPHLAHAAASLMMAIEQATTNGLLPDDPGRPWEKEVKAKLPENVPKVFNTGWTVTKNHLGAYTVRDTRGLMVGTYPDRADAEARAKVGKVGSLDASFKI